MTKYLDSEEENDLKKVRKKLRLHKKSDEEIVFFYDLIVYEMYLRGI